LGLATLLPQYFLPSDQKQKDQYALLDV